MAITTSERDGAVILALSGAMLGGPEANSLNAELHRITESGGKAVVLDLTQVTHMNSSGLGLLIGGLTTMRKAGGELLLAGAGENIAQLIAITKLHTIFRLFPTVDAAVAALRP
jgi:anti-sigma B factor antagonist